MDLWHARLGHLGNTMIRRMINNVQDLPLKLEHLNHVKSHFCVPCAQVKLVIRPSLYKYPYESLKFLERIHSDIHGPIHPPSAPFYYFMGVKDASSQFSHVTLLFLLATWRCLDSSPLLSSCVFNFLIFQLSRSGWIMLPSLRQQPLLAIVNLSTLILKFQLLMFTLKMVWLNL